VLSVVCTEEVATYTGLFLSQFKAACSDVCRDMALDVEQLGSEMSVNARKLVHKIEHVVTARGHMACSLEAHIAAAR